MDRMEQLMHDWCLGVITEEDRARLLAAMGHDPALSERFAELQRAYLAVAMMPGTVDEARAKEGLARLHAMRRRRAFRRVGLRVARYAAAVVLFAAVGLGVYRYTARPGEVEYAEATAPAGERLEVSLADGSRVWLAPRSTLSYPVKFPRRGDRDVRLSGEALFDVTHDGAQPFHVRSGGYTVRVLGTKFTTSSYGDRFETVLVEGAVEVWEDARTEETKITLAPGQRARRGDDGRLETEDVDTSAALSLQSGIVEFKDETFAAITARLSEWYGIGIEIRDEELAGVRFTTKFRDGEDIETILKVLHDSRNFNFKRDETGTITIY